MNISRREFVKTSAAGIAGASMLSWREAEAAKDTPFLGPVTLGKTGIQTSFLSFGTGTHGSNKASKQTRLGSTAFIDLAQHVYDSGVRFFDAADSYGSHPFLKEAFRQVPRENITLLSKLWNRPSDWANFTTAQAAVDRFRKEMDQDYIDIVLMHCMVDGDWTTRYRKVMDGLSELKVKGVIGSYGASFHSIYALQAAIKSDWPEILLARINDTGTLMDHYPNVVAPMLQQARKDGKGVIGMKIFGGGKTKTDEQRESSLNFVMKANVVDMVTMGFGSALEFDDAIQRMKRISKDTETKKG
jgi:1-deoxyxylulose-5-phosphate synthase